MLLTTLSLLLLSGAPFEGVVHATLVSPNSTAVLTTWVSAAGVRAESNVMIGEMRMKQIVLVRADAPAVAHIYDTQHTAWRTGPVGAASKAAPRPLIAERVGHEQIAGIDCEHVKLADDAGLELEYWFGHLPGATAVEPLFSSAMQLAPTVLKALSDVHVSGFPMRVVARHAGVVDATITVVKVETKPVPASRFEPHL